MKRLPVPETRTAVLPNLRGRPTPHRYVRSEVASPLVGEGARGVAHLFRCEVTGEVRRWGFEKVPAGYQEDVT